MVLNGTRAGLGAIRALLEPSARGGLGHAAARSGEPRWTALLTGDQRLTERDAKAFCAAHGMTVTREMSGCSVGETDSELMLNARRANRPAIRASTPGRFSTSTESVWRLEPG